MNFEQIEQIAIDHPDDAEFQLLQSSRPDKEDIRYLRFILSKMQGKENRTVDLSWREGFDSSLKSISPDVQEMASQLMKGEALSDSPPKEEPVHGFHQEQGQRETVDPAEESVQGE